jgi:poly-gamma-glutamate synthesis protein (capsule biosynthesis protein)
MSKRNYKFPILFAILGLCITGLIAFSAVCVLVFCEDVSQKGIHFSDPAGLDFFETAFNFPKKEFQMVNKNPIAGIIPHHLLASDMIAEFFYNLRGKEYDTIILLGPNHFNAGNFDITVSKYNWQTPYGILESDEDVLDELLGLNGAGISEEVFEKEHSMTSEVSFIKKTFGKAKIAPVVLKPGITSRQAEALAEKIFKISKIKKILVLASVDFSHYKDSLTAQENDKESIDAIKYFDFGKIYNLDIDSPASIYTALKFSQLYGAEFSLLSNSNSAILASKPDLEATTSYVTGYFIQPDLDEDVVKMLFLGDLMLGRDVRTKIEENGLGYIFEPLDEVGFFSGYDLISANLEGAVTDGGAYYPPEKEFDFAFKPETVAELKKYNFSFFNLANNHLGDQGAQGMDETRKNLDAMGFGYSGCENVIISDCAGKIVLLKNKKIGIIGLTAYWDNFDSERAKGEINKMKEKTDLVIVNIHWGEEYNTQFSTRQQELARAFVDAGADVIIGHHPHVVQGVEIYKEKPIFYSLGNFVFDQYFSEETQKGLAVELISKDDELSFNLYPLKLQSSRPGLMTDSEEADFLRRIDERSAR